MTTNEIRAEIRHLEQCDGRDGDCSKIYDEIQRLEKLLDAKTPQWVIDYYHETNELPNEWRHLLPVDVHPTGEIIGTRSADTTWYEVYESNDPQTCCKLLGFCMIDGKLAMFEHD